MNMNQSFGGLNSPMFYPTLRDTRTDRLKLTDKLTINNNTILKLQAENVEIEEALKLLDENPIMERLTNVLRRLIG